MILATANGTLLKEVGGDSDAVTLKTGLSTTARGVFAEAGEETTGAIAKLIYFTGSNPPQVVSGDAGSSADLALPAADWSGSNQPIAGVVHGDGLWAWGNPNQPHGAYRSGPDNHEDFQCAEQVFLMVFPGIGSRLMCGLDHDRHFFLFKWPKGIFVLDDSDVRTSVWRFETVSRVLGVCHSPHAALEVPGDILFLSDAGSFHLVSRLLAKGGPDEEGIIKSDLSEDLGIKGWMRANLNLARLDQVQSRWFEHKSLAVFAIPKAGGTANYAKLMFDFSRYQEDRRILFSYDYRDDCSALWLRKDSGKVERLVAGDSTGKVYLLDEATRRKNGATYTSKFRMAETDFGYLDASLAGRKKDFDFFEVVANPKGTSAVTLTTYLDGTARETKTLDANRRTHKTRIRGSGQYFSYELSGVDDYSIAAVRVYFRPGREVANASG